MRARTLVAALLLVPSYAALSLIGCQSKPPPSVTKENLQQVTARVDAIQRETRMLTLSGADGTKAAISVGPEVVNFDQIKVGDHVVVSYYRAIAAELKKNGEAVHGTDTSTVGARASPGEKPYGGVGAAVSTTVVIHDVDTKANTVTFWADDGAARTLEVKSPEGQKFIRKLKRGDEVEVVYTEAMAVEVKPAA
jgi:hypothetical protein